jgi:hypothetical protein
MDKAFNEISETLGTPLNAPKFNTKKSEINPSLNYDTIQHKFGKQLEKIFKIEYKDLYNND